MAKLTEAAEANAKQVKGDKLLEQAVKGAQMDVPECMYETKMDQMMREFENNISRQGLSVDVYCQYLGTTADALKEQFREPAKNNVDARLVLEQIAVEEGLTTTTEEENAEITKIAESYGIEAEKMIEVCSDEDRKAISKDLLVQKALKLIEDTAVEVEKKAE